MFDISKLEIRSELIAGGQLELTRHTKFWEVVEESETYLKLRFKEDRKMIIAGTKFIYGDFKKLYMAIEEDTRLYKYGIIK